MWYLHLHKSGGWPFIAHELKNNVLVLSWIYIYTGHELYIPCRLMGVRFDSSCYFAKAALLRLIIASSIAFWSVNGANPSAPPVLVDTSSCPDIADALMGNRTIETASKHMVRLHTPHPLVSGSNCIVSFIFLDCTPKWALTTSYGREMQHNQENISGLWDTHKLPISPNQQLIVVTCDENTINTDDVSMPSTTDFSFILAEPRAETTLETMECGKAFCMIRITTKTCMNSKYIIGMYPSTNNYIFEVIHMQMSLMGAAASMMRLVAFDAIHNRVPEKRVIMGVDSFAQYATFTATCINEVGDFCTLPEATRFADELVTGMQMSLNAPEDAFLFENMQQIDGTDNMYAMNFVFFNSEFGYDEHMRLYFSKNRRCPVGTLDTKRVDTFYGNSAIYKLMCISCGINKYYSEVQTPAPVVETTQTMYVFRGINSEPTNVTNERSYIRYYFVTSHATLPKYFREQFRQDSSVPIGTTLVLKMGIGTGDNNVLQGTTIQRVEYDGIDVSFTASGVDTTDYAVSFQVTAQLSGKLIRVHVNDANCCLNEWENSDYTFSPDFKIIPALIFPQPANVEQGCLTCPAGKFSGNSMAKDISKCLDTRPPATTIVRRRSAAAVGTDRAFRTYIDVNGVILVVLEITRVVPPALASSDFALQAWLDTGDLLTVQQNMQIIETYILHLYEPQRSDVRISGTSSVRLVEQNGLVILSLEGMYTDSGKNVDLGIVQTLRQPVTAWTLSWFWLGIMCSGAILVAGVIVLVCYLVPPYTTLPFEETYRYGAV